MLNIYNTSNNKYYSKDTIILRVIQEENRWQKQTKGTIGSNSKGIFLMTKE